MLRTPRIARALAHSARSYSQNAAAAFKHSMDDPREFWRAAADAIHWEKPFDTVLDTSNPPFYKWFVGGTTNTCYNAVDRHIAAGRGDQQALVYDSPQTSLKTTLTYTQLRAEVEAAAGMLRAHGVGLGDRVIVYMPMIPETLISMLACARIGAIHSVVFGGFASHELAVRIDDAKPKLVLAGSAGIEGAGKVVQYQPLLDGALKMAKHKVGTVIMKQRPAAPTPKATMEHATMKDWDAEVQAIKSKRIAADPAWVDSAHPQYIIYTSGSTGTPKGVVRDTGGHQVALKWSMPNIFGINPGDTWWAASDPAWVVGASYICYAPLLNGSTTVMFDGKPVGAPDADAYWRVCRDYNVKAMFTAPTALRAIKKEDPDAKFIATRGIGKLEAMFVAGERCDPDTVKWAHSALQRPVIDHYWLTELGWPCCANFKGLGLHPTVPGSAGKPVPGWDLRVLSPNLDALKGDGTAGSEFFATRTDDSHHMHHAGMQKWDGATVGAASAAAATAASAAAAKTEAHHDRVHPSPFLKEADVNELGPLAVRLPLPPGALTTLYNAEDRFKKGYTDPFPGYFSLGDASFKDENGYIHIMSRIDDIINVAGHRLSTGAIEAAIASHPAVAECACIGPHDDLKGQVPVALVVLKKGVVQTGEQVAADLVKLVRAEVGPIAAFRTAVIVNRLPKTRSGKVLRATMKTMADGQPFKMPATIDDASVLPEIEAALKAAGFCKPIPEDKM